MSDTKHCTGPCGRTLPTDAFYRRKPRPGDYHKGGQLLPRCKDCRCAAAKAYVASLTNLERKAMYRKYAQAKRLKNTRRATEAWVLAGAPT